MIDLIPWYSLRIKAARFAYRWGSRSEAVMWYVQVSNRNRMTMFSIAYTLKPFYRTDRPGSSDTIH